MQWEYKHIHHRIENCEYQNNWNCKKFGSQEISRNNPLTPQLKEKILAVDGVKSINSRTSASAFVSLPNGAAADFYLHTFTREEEQEFIDFTPSTAKIFS